jgi:hypothetical protein
MKEIFKIINDAIINLKNEIAESKRLNKSLWKSNEHIIEENRMLRNDLCELSKMYQELKNKK